MSADRSAELALLQSMGFPEAACDRALTATNGDANRALDWLLANPAEAAAVGLPARPVIFTLGFDEALVQRALRQAGDNEERAVELLLNDEVRDAADVGSDAAVDSSARPLIYTLGFHEALVELALRRAGGDADRAANLLLNGEIDDDGSGNSGGEEEESEVEDADDQAIPAEWPGDPEVFETSMEESIDAYLQWCQSSLSGGVHPNRQHHEQWLLSQLASTRAQFDSHNPDSRPPGYCALRHTQYVIATLRSRYPGIRLRRLREVKLNIDRARVVDSTADFIGGLADDDIPDAGKVKVKFQDQSGYDAGGLTDDWLSLFMLEVMDPFRQPPLFLLPRQMDSSKEAYCLRLNHSLQAFGVSEERQRALMRTIGFVLAVCLKKGRFACNKYMLSKSLLQRLLGQELPPGLLGLSEEYPDEYQMLEDIRKHPEYLELGEKKYTACSRVSDLYDVQRYLKDCIDRSERQIDLEHQRAAEQPLSPASRDRVALRQELINEVVTKCFSEGVDSIKAIKTAFFHRNEQLPPDTQYHAINGGEVRAKLRELRGEARSSQDSDESSRILSLQSSIVQHRQLMETLRAAEVELKRLRHTQVSDTVVSDEVDSAVHGVVPSTDVTALNFDAYCEHLVQKRMLDDIQPLLQAMQQGFWAVYDGCEALKLMKVGDVQHKLFPLDPVTVDQFRKNSRCQDSANARLMWKVMEEELSEQQVQNVFYFATNWHTVSGARRKVEISFEKRSSQNDLAPRAATCSWSLQMPDCLAPGDKKGTSSVSRERMLQALLTAANTEAQGYGFG